jgi:hypothetical protein
MEELPALFCRAPAAVCRYTCLSASGTLCLPFYIPGAITAMPRLPYCSAGVWATCIVLNLPALYGVQYLPLLSFIRCRAPQLERHLEVGGWVPCSFLLLPVLPARYNCIAILFTAAILECLLPFCLLPASVSSVVCSVLPCWSIPGHYHSHSPFSACSADASVLQVEGTVGILPAMLFLPVCLNIILHVPFQHSLPFTLPFRSFDAFPAYIAPTSEQHGHGDHLL